MTNQTEKLNILIQIFGSYQRSGNEHLFYCPACDHHKRKFSINLEKDVGKCWICQYRASNLKFLIDKHGNHDQRNKWGTLTGQIDLSQKKDLFAEKQEEKVENIHLPPEFISLTSPRPSTQARLAKKYLKERGVEEKDIIKWKMGYAPDGDHEGRVIIPSFNLSGMINYYIARTYTDQFPKYKNPHTNRNIVFNELYVDWSNPIILVEGVFDAIVAGDNSIPLLGSSLAQNSKLFESIIKYSPPVYFAMDTDARKKELKIIRDMLQYGISVFKIEIEPYEDVGSMPKEVFVERKNKAQPITQSTLLKYKMEKVW